MKHTVFLVLISLFPLLGLQAQEADTTRFNRKIGITFRNLDHFGLIYKTKLDQRYLRIEALNIGSKLKNSIEPKPAEQYFKLNLGFNVGLENHHILNQNVDLIHGGSLISKVGFGFAEQKKKIYGKYFRFDVGFGYILGINYHINNKFELSAELLPSLRYSYYQRKNPAGDNEPSHETRVSHEFQLDIRNNAMFSILYNF